MRHPPPRENAILHSFTRFLGEKGVRLNELKRARILQFRDCAEYRFVYALRHSSKKIISSLTLLSLPISYSNLFIIFFLIHLLDPVIQQNIFKRTSFRSISFSRILVKEGAFFNLKNYYQNPLTIDCKCLKNKRLSKITSTTYYRATVTLSPSPNSHYPPYPILSSSSYTTPRETAIEPETKVHPVTLSSENHSI